MRNKSVFLLGNGIRNNPSLVNNLLEMSVPTMTTWMSMDLVPENHESFCGRPGTIGQRGANIILQECDNLYVFGARLDDDTVAFNLDNFAKNANKFVYDVDVAELNKYPQSWRKIIVDFDNYTMGFPKPQESPDWLFWCKAVHNDLRYELEGQENDRYVDPYKFVSLMSDLCQEDEIIALGSSGFAPVSFLHAFKVKKGQRIIGCSTLGSMGIDVPMAIGACIGSGNKRTITPTGDGGFSMNFQELEVARRLNLPIKFFIYNNSGYGSIKSMQKGKFGGHLVGCNAESGLTLPSIKNIAKCFDIDYCKIPSLSKDFFRKAIEKCMETPNPSIIELMIDPDWMPSPKVASSIVDGKIVSDDFENMSPKIDVEEYKKKMYEIIKDV
jgi:acetolactate synthase-1/2/3 large subunit